MPGPGTGRSAGAGTAGADAWPGAARRSLASRPLAVMARTLDAQVAAGLEAVPCHALPRVRFRGPVHDVRAAVAGGLASSGLAPRHLADWLADDASGLATLYASLAGSREVALRLEGVHGDSCRLLHVDAVRMRLVTTYVGPGTDYLPRARPWEGWYGCRRGTWPCSAARRAFRTASRVCRTGRRPWRGPGCTGSSCPSTREPSRGPGPWSPRPPPLRSRTRPPARWQAGPPRSPDAPRGRGARPAGVLPRARTSAWSSSGCSRASAFGPSRAAHRKSGASSPA